MDKWMDGQSREFKLVQEKQQILDINHLSLESRTQEFNKSIQDQFDKSIKNIFDKNRTDEFKFTNIDKKLKLFEKTAHLVKTQAAGISELQK